MERHYAMEYFAKLHMEVGQCLVALQGRPSCSNAGAGTAWNCVSA